MPLHHAEREEQPDAAPELSPTFRGGPPAPRSPPPETRVGCVVGERQIPCPTVARSAGGKPLSHDARSNSGSSAPRSPGSSSGPCPAGTLPVTPCILGGM